MTDPTDAEIEAMAGLPARLRAACNGHPAANIPWPHYLLHEAADRIEALTSALGALVDADVCYSDRDIVIRCACPNEAMHKVLEARLALAKARGE